MRVGVLVLWVGLTLFCILVCAQDATEGGSKKEVSRDLARVRGASVDRRRRGDGEEDVVGAEAAQMEIKPKKKKSPEEIEAGRSGSGCDSSRCIPVSEIQITACRQTQRQCRRDSCNQSLGQEMGLHVWTSPVELREDRSQTRRWSDGFLADQPTGRLCQEHVVSELTIFSPVFVQENIMKTIRP